jgi:hypothetical protein
MPDGDPSLAWKDVCVWTWTIFWLAPKILALFIPMYFLSLLPLLITYIYTTCQRGGLKQLERNGTFWAVLVFSFSLYIPVLVLAAVSLLLDYVMYYLFGFCFTLFTWRWSQCWKSHRVIDPYRGGPSVIVPTDIFCCIAGQTMRHGCHGTMYNVTVMWLLIPWLKYFWNCNPWVYDLDERYIQQISTSMEDLGTPDMGGIENICDTARKIISRAKQYWFTRINTDYWHFVPHYPLPPAGRRWAVGMQCGGSVSTPICFTLLVHTTHADSDHGGSTEQFILSNSVYPGGKPVYRVMLWYNNPYHFLTGYVEASISNGGHSQPEKFNGGEHPMWLVTGKSPLLSGRDSLTGSGMIDAFFDDWLPLFVHECRRQGFFQSHHLELAMRKWKQNQFKDLTLDEYTKMMEEAMQKGNDYADARYEEVVSKDGISQPTGKLGRKDGGTDKLSIQRAQESLYMDFQHMIVDMSATSERKMLMERVIGHMQVAEQERENLRHILNLHLDHEGTEIQDDYVDRSWTTSPHSPACSTSGADASQSNASGSGGLASHSNI